MDKLIAIEKLENLLQTFKNFEAKSIRTRAFLKWEKDAESAIEDIFGINSRQSKAFCDEKWFRTIRFNQTNSSLLEEVKKSFIEEQMRAEASLLSMIDEIKEHWGKEPDASITKEVSVKAKKITSKIFIVHGLDKPKCETVARFLEKLKLLPIILHEQPNKGRTIIQKFIDYSDVSFAVILFTADDYGGLKGTLIDNLKFRARQNVILELGFFLAQLGPDRVCTLFEEGVEIPSDYHGILFIPFDALGAWRLRLAQEIKEAGLPISMDDLTL